MSTVALLHASKVLTGRGVKAKDGRRIKEEHLDAIEDGAMVFSIKAVAGKSIPDRILWVGKTSELPKKFSKAKRRNLKGENAVIPGLIDCHTHLVFGGNRANEFSERCAGATYEEIAAKGGGIRASIFPTRESSEETLFKSAAARLEASIRLGVRGIEIKSGYGLNHEAEIKCLKVVQRLKKAYPEIAIHSTYLGAHAFPPDQSRESYLREMEEKTLPEVLRKKLADSVDVFIDRGYYTLDEGRKILGQAKNMGVPIRLHADELADTNSTRLGAELQAKSVDHLLCVSDASVETLAKSQTVGVLLPGTAFFLKAPYAPARKLIDAGACVAIATDWNPGSCMSGHLPVMMTLSALYMKMTGPEIFSAVTYAPAKALGWEKTMGSLEPKSRACFTILPFRSFEEVYYNFAWVP